MNGTQLTGCWPGAIENGNPLYFLLAIVLLLVSKNAGWRELDRFVLPALGTPWHRGRICQPAPTAASITPEA